jgi:hypothetical protein
MEVPDNERASEVSISMVFESLLPRELVSWWMVVLVSRDEQNL